MKHFLGLTTKKLIMIATVAFAILMPGITRAQPLTLSGITVAFPPDQQTITGTSATFKGTVTVAAPITMDLRYVAGVRGEPLGNESRLLTATLNPGDTRTITFSITGLTPGKSYAFALKNGANVSRQLWFTTPDGSSTPNPIFAGGTLGTDGDPGPLVAEFTDTISDRGIVPKCGRTAGDGVLKSEERMCGYKDFLQLISNVLEFAIVLIGPVVAIIALYSGAMIIWLKKKGDPREETMKKIRAHAARLGNVVIGIIIIISAWILIATIVRELGVKDDYILIDIFTGN